MSPNTPYEKIPAIPSFDAVNRITGFSAGSSAATPTLGDRLATLQNELPARYAPLAAALRAPVGPDGGLAMKAHATACRSTRMTVPRCQRPPTAGTPSA